MFGIPIYLLTFAVVEMDTPLEKGQNLHRAFFLNRGMLYFF